MKDLNMYDLLFLSYFLIAGYIFYDFMFVILTIVLFSVRIIVKGDKN